jgi:predicted kinase
MLKNRTVIILRGVPGNGKTTFAKLLELLCDLSETTFMNCCADEWFEDANGNYNYKADEIGKAHAWCKNQFQAALDGLIDIVVVANTNTRADDVKRYRNMAEEAGYRTFVLTVENWHNGTDVHNVPEDVKQRMKKQLLETIKL